MSSVSKFSSLSSTYVFGVAAAIGFVNYYFLFAVKVRKSLMYIKSIFYTNKWFLLMLCIIMDILILSSFGIRLIIL